MPTAENGERMFLSKSISFVELYFIDLATHRSSLAAFSHLAGYLLLHEQKNDMKKILSIALVIVIASCNDSASVSQPNDLDHTQNNDTNRSLRVDTTKTASDTAAIKR
ncbi:MAG: hypothetical protein ACJ75B_01595 [Flavisolibacter sp.]